MNPEILKLVAASDIAPLLAPLKEREAQVIERIIGWANINSGSRNPEGVARMAALVGSQLEELTGDVATFPLSPDEEIQDDGKMMRHPVGPAIRARCRPDAPVQILLNGHLDTVFGPEHPFQRVRRDGKRLLGPGVADMKGGLVVMIEALRILEAAPFRDRVGWEVLLNPDEEVGSPCSVGILEEAARRHHVGLVFEPALPDGSLVSGRLGVGNFLVRVQGRSAHAGRTFQQGRNAIVALAGLISGVHDLNREPGVIVNVGRISGGGDAINIVPAEAACRLNVRVDSMERAAQVEKRIHGLVNELNEVEGFRAEVSGRLGRPPKPVTPVLEALLAEFQMCARESGFDLVWAWTGGASDGNILAAAGLPTVDSLGVRGGAIHTANEFMEIPSVIERTALTARFLLKVARGDIVLPR